MRPTLQAAIAAQVAQGCGRIVVVPVFFGQGGHVRQDLPRLLNETRSAHPDVRIACTPAVGENEAVLRAIAELCDERLARGDTARFAAAAGGILPRSAPRTNAGELGRHTARHARRRSFGHTGRIDTCGTPVSRALLRTAPRIDPLIPERHARRRSA
ncbi:hypothetical protein DFQ28_009358 [Apophysomyces sp. BC1034]|nr:hypothetical protein DFQ30_000426 [Apophysomyces sp. BC1015]KAG0192405.1 hypothetical protein DFQ28_009358 [Apophysomyces sp. BC1034]